VGIAVSGADAGSKLVFADPAPRSGRALRRARREQVTLTCGVPTIWLRLLEYLDRTSCVSRASVARCRRLGAAARVIEAFEVKYGVTVLNAWGMTETSPACTYGTPRPAHDVLPQRIDYKTRAGRALFGVEIRIVDDDGTPLPFDGVAQGEIHVRGPWIASGYFEDEEATARGVTADGWLRTGDIASIDAHGYVQIRDRAKDVIKSGGEWISSIELENVAVAHPDIAEAAAIGIPHPTWSERPVLYVVAGARPRARCGERHRVPRRKGRQVVDPRRGDRRGGAPAHGDRKDLEANAARPLRDRGAVTEPFDSA